MANAFAAYLAEHHRDLDAYLDAFFVDRTDDADLDAYLYAPLREFSENGGKRHRPLICMLAAQATGGDPARARSAAAAIEHFQSAALIHDDIADKGRLRRGKPCMYLTEGVGRAINCGDYDLTLVCDAVLRDRGLDDATKLRVIGELTAMMQRTVEGQALDLGWVQDGRSTTTSSWRPSRPRITAARCRWPWAPSSAGAPMSRWRRCAASAWTPASPSRSRTTC